MAATVNINSFHGSAGATVAAVDGTTIRFKLADNDTNDSNNPIAIPASGTVWSWLKQFKFHIGATPPSTQIANLKVYTSGAAPSGWTGVDIKCQTSASYTDPTAQQATMLTGMDTATSVFSATSGSPISVTGSGSSANTDVGNYIEMQMSVASTASAGQLTAATLTFQYDES